MGIIAWVDVIILFESERHLWLSRHHMIAVSSPSTLVRMSTSIPLNDIPALVDRIDRLAAASDGRVVVSVAGVPGSGKTTVATEVVAQLNARGIKAVALTMDGFHLYRHQLTTEEMVRRRGAPFTFDQPRFVATVALLKPAYRVKPVLAPSFDHSVKDPVEDDVKIEPDVKVVVVEGNYTSLTDDGWSDIGDIVDELWFVATPLEVAQQRLVARHLLLGVAATVEEAQQRASGSDYDNLVYLLNRLRAPDVVITHVDHV